MLENKFIFDLQRFGIEDGITIEPAGAGTFVANDDDLESITLSEAGKITVNGYYNFDFIDPNGTSTTVTVRNATGDVVVQYTSAGDTILDLSGLTSTGNTISVVNAGGADYLVPPSAENALRISGTTYAYDNESGKAQFILNSSGAATGFVFGGNNDIITVPKGASLTFQDEDGTNLTFGIAGSSQAYTIVRRADDVYEVQVFGSAIVSDSDTTLTFTTAKALDNAVSVYFDDAGNILSVDGLDNLGTSDAMTVVSSSATTGNEGLAIGDPTGVYEGYISVGSGDFIYKNGVVTVNSGDTIYSLNGYNLASTGNIITDINGVTYNYKGKGYFVYDDDAGITGFVFTTKNDSITVPTDAGINLFYLDQATAITVPAITDTENYTFKLSNVRYATDPKFQISGLDKGSVFPAVAPFVEAIVAEDTDNVITTDINGNIKAIDKFTTSGITFAAGTYDITINGDYLSYKSAGDLTAVADGNNLVSVSGLTGSDTINAGTNENIIFQYEVEGNAELNINGESYPIEGEGKQAVYITGGGETLATVSGIKVAKGLTINPTDKIITVAKSSLNKNTVTVDGDYGLELAKNVTTPKTKGAWSIDTSTSKATYKETTSAGYSVEGNEIIYSTKETTPLVTVEGVKSVKGLSLNEDVVTVGKASLKKANVKVSDDYTLVLAEDVTEPTSTGAWSLKNSTATYKQITKAGYTLEDNEIIYSNKKTTSLVTVEGVKSVKGLSLNEDVVTVAKASLKKADVKVSDGYTLTLADDVTQPTSTGAWSLRNSTATYKGSSTAGYTLADDGKSITYTKAKSTATLATVKGVQSVEGLSLKNNVITVANSSLNQGTVTVNDGYTLELAEDVTRSSTTPKGWTINDNVATYKTKETTAGYSVSNNQISYTEASGGESLITVSGVKSIEELSLNGKVVKVANSALNQDAVTISDGYTLALADDVTAPKINAEWSLRNSTATYKGTTTAGYTLAEDGKSITYTEAKSGEKLATVTGVKSVDGLKVNGTTIIVAASSLNATDVTVSDGYSLALADDVTLSETTEANLSLDGSIATYTAEQTTAGYKLEDNKISYVEASGGDTLIINGVKSTDGLSISDKVVTVSEASLGTSKVTLSNDEYTLALDDDVTKSTVKNEAWSFKSSTATYNQTTTAGYLLEDNAITYTKKGTTTLATVKGIKSTNGLKVSGKVITVSKASLGTSKVTLSGDGYTLKLNSDVTKPTSKNASWTLKNSTATYKGSMTAGYTLANDSKSITYSKATSAKTLATIKGAKSTNGLSVSDNVIKLKNSALASKVTVGGSYEFDFQSDYKKATITGSGSADTVTVRGSDIKLNGGSGADSLSGGSSNDSINGGTGNDLIFGNKGSDTLLGGAGNDSLWGGAGNDSLYGGAGNDTFIYKPGEGTDTIFDFQTGDMLAILQSDGKEGGTFTSSSFKSGNLTLGISGGGSVIFDGVSKNGTFNINGDNYKISGSKLVQK